MEEQQQAGKQRQRRHRGAAGDDGRRGARAAARGPHHGGCLTRSGAPRAGQPGHPRRGAAAASAAVATPAVRRAEVGCEAETARESAGTLRGRGRWLRRGCSQGRGDGRAAGAGGGQPSAGCGRRRGPAEVPRTISRLAAGCPRGAPGRPSGASLGRAPAGGCRQGGRRASEPEGTVQSGGEVGRDERGSAARSSRPREGSREGGGGSTHAADRKSVV